MSKSIIDVIYDTIENGIIELQSKIIYLNSDDVGVNLDNLDSINSFLDIKNRSFYKTILVKTVNNLLKINNIIKEKNIMVFKSITIVNNIFNDINKANTFYESIGEKGISLIYDKIEGKVHSSDHDNTLESTYSSDPDNTYEHTTKKESIKPQDLLDINIIIKNVYCQTTCVDELEIPIVCIKGSDIEDVTVKTIDDEKNICVNGKIINFSNILDDLTMTTKTISFNTGIRLEVSDLKMKISARFPILAVLNNFYESILSPDVFKVPPPPTKSPRGRKPKPKPLKKKRNLQEGSSGKHFASQTTFVMIKPNRLRWMFPTMKKERYESFDEMVYDIDLFMKQNNYTNYNYFTNTEGLKEKDFNEMFLTHEDFKFKEFITGVGQQPGVKTNDGEGEESITLISDYIYTCLDPYYNGVNKSVQYNDPHLINFKSIINRHISSQINTREIEELFKQIYFKELLDANGNHYNPFELTLFHVSSNNDKQNTSKLFIKFINPNKNLKKKKEKYITLKILLRKVNIEGSNSDELSKQIYNGLKRLFIDYYERIFSVIQPKFEILDGGDCDDDDDEIYGSDEDDF